jgi:hypothetical protein
MALISEQSSGFHHRIPSAQFGLCSRVYFGRHFTGRGASPALTQQWRYDEAPGPLNDSQVRIFSQEGFDRTCMGLSGLRRQETPAFMIGYLHCLSLSTLYMTDSDF